MFQIITILDKVFFFLPTQFQLEPKWWFILSSKMGGKKLLQLYFSNSILYFVKWSRSCFYLDNTMCLRRPSKMYDGNGWKFMNSLMWRHCNVEPCYVTEYRWYSGWSWALCITTTKHTAASLWIKIMISFPNSVVVIFFCHKCPFLFDVSLDCMS